MILKIGVKLLLSTERCSQQQRLLIFVTLVGLQGSLAPLLKDNSSSAGLRNQKLLVQIQVEAVPLEAVSIVTSIITIFALLIYPIFATLKLAPHQGPSPLTNIKNSVKIAFFVSLIPLLVYLHQGAEIVTSTFT